MTINNKYLIKQIATTSLVYAAVNGFTPCPPNFTHLSHHNHRLRLMAMLLDFWLYKI